jgi:hypothetical protein
MSDGPHKSLPMRPGWKRVAECGDKAAFASEEISGAIVSALHRDCRTEMIEGRIDGIYRAFRDQDTALFKDQIGPRLESLRETAGSGIGRVILDHAIRVAERGGTGMDGMVKAVANALNDHAARGARQVEEHYRRKSNSTRAQKLRARIEQGISGADMKGLARQILGVDPRPSSRPAARKKGLDDGVKL